MADTSSTFRKCLMVSISKLLVRDLGVTKVDAKVLTLLTDVAQHVISDYAVKSKQLAEINCRSQMVLTDCTISLTTKNVSIKNMLDYAMRGLPNLNLNQEQEKVPELEEVPESPKMLQIGPEKIVGGSTHSKIIPNLPDVTQRNDDIHSCAVYHDDDFKILRERASQQKIDTCMSLSMFYGRQAYQNNPRNGAYAYFQEKEIEVVSFEGVGVKEKDDMQVDTTSFATNWLVQPLMLEKALPDVKSYSSYAF